MKILILDDDPSEWVGKIISPLLSKLLTQDPSIFLSLNGKVRTSRSADGRRFVIDVSAPVRNKSGCYTLAKAKAPQFDLFLVDHSLQGQIDSCGIDLASYICKQCHVPKHCVWVVTNKSLDQSIKDNVRRGLLPTTGDSFRSFSKSEVAPLAKALLEAHQEPCRKRLIANDLNEHILKNENILKQKGVINNFFHGIRCADSYCDATKALSRFKKTAKSLKEAMLLLDGPEGMHMLMSNHKRNLTIPLSEVQGYRGSANRLTQLIQKASDPLKTLLKHAMTIADDSEAKLIDVLFPRVGGSDHQAFWSFCNGCFTKYGLTLEESASPLVRVPKCDRNSRTPKAILPLSWFQCLDSNFLGNLVRYGFPNLQGKKVVKMDVFRINKPGAACVLFWHERNGYSNEESFDESLMKLSSKASEFAHCFVATTLDSRRVSLREILPNVGVGTSLVRQPSGLRVLIASMEIIDFSKLVKGTAYLFIVPTNESTLKSL